MEEENKETPKDKYIKCSKCNCKYNNDDESIKTNFGYTRLNERFKTCCKCRTKHRQHRIDNPHLKEYEQRYNNSLEVKERRKNRESEILTCPLCNREFPKATMYQHKRTHPALVLDK